MKMRTGSSQTPLSGLNGASTGARASEAINQARSGLRVLLVGNYTKSEDEPRRITDLEKNTADLKTAETPSRPDVIVLDVFLRRGQMFEASV